MVRHRVRIRFCKQGDLRLIGHHDLMRAWERTFRRAGVALRMSQGFRPKPRMAFASALAMGVIGADEVLDVELAEASSAERLQEVLAARLPDGLSVKSIEILPEDAPRTRVERVTYEVAVPHDRCPAVGERLHANPAMANPAMSEPPNCAATETGAGRDPRQFLDSIELTGDRLRFTAQVTSEGTVRPRELLAWLGLDDLDEHGIYLTRTAVELAT